MENCEYFLYKILSFIKKERIFHNFSWQQTALEKLTLTDIQCFHVLEGFTGIEPGSNRLWAPIIYQIGNALIVKKLSRPTNLWLIQSQLPNLAFPLDWLYQMWLCESKIWASGLAQIFEDEPNLVFKCCTSSPQLIL